MKLNPSLRPLTLSVSAVLATLLIAPALWPETEKRFMNWAVPGDAAVQARADLPARHAQDPGGTSIVRGAIAGVIPSSANAPDEVVSRERWSRESPLERRFRDLVTTLRKASRGAPQRFTLRGPAPAGVGEETALAPDFGDISMSLALRLETAGHAALPGPESAGTEPARETLRAFEANLLADLERTAPASPASTGPCYSLIPIGVPIVPLDSGSSVGFATAIWTNPGISSVANPATSALQSPISYGLIPAALSVSGTYPASIGNSSAGSLVFTPPPSAATPPILSNFASSQVRVSGSSVPLSGSYRLGSGISTVRPSAPPLVFPRIVLASATSQAQITPTSSSATWRSSPVDNNFQDPANWSTMSVPSTANFGTSTITAVSTGSIELDSFVFLSPASAYTFTVYAQEALYFSGAGISNGSGITQNFVAATDPTQGASTILFGNGATAGSKTAFTNDGGAIADGSGGGITEFDGTSTTEYPTAGNATFTNNGTTVNNGGAGGTQFVGSASAGNGIFINNGSAYTGGGGFTAFFDTSTASNAKLTANGGSAGSQGLIAFTAQSTGGTATVILNGNGSLDISGETSAITGATPSVSIGSLTGDASANVFLGANNLTVGTNGASTTFSGVIRDGGIVVTGGTGGSLTKVGAGTLILSGANTYTGMTTVSAGTLEVDGSIAGSTTQVNMGATLSGNGTVDGSVTNSGFVSPGNASPGELKFLGNYTQTGALNIGINGTSASGNFSSLAVSGTASVGGNLNVMLANGFVPVDGDVYSVLSAKGLSGKFNSGSHIVEATPVPADAPGNFFKVNYSSGVSLQAITAADILKTGSLSNPTFKTSGGRTSIDSNFTPNDNLTLGEAAQVCGVDHFNFLSEIIYVPSAWQITDNGSIVKPAGGYIQPNQSIIDPLPGSGVRVETDARSSIGGPVKYGPGFTDNNPSYYDDDIVTTMYPITGSVLTFEDSPSVLTGMFANQTGANGETMEFYTQLVGVSAQGAILDYYGNTSGLGFTWYSNQTADGGTVYNSTLSTETGLPPATGGSIYGVQFVPEPTGVSLLVFGAAGLLLRRKRLTVRRS